MNLRYLLLRKYISFTFQFVSENLNMYEDYNDRIVVIIVLVCVTVNIKHYLTAPEKICFEYQWLLTLIRL